MKSIVSPLIIFQLILSKLVNPSIHSSGTKKPNLSQLEGQWDKK